MGSLGQSQQRQETNQQQDPWRQQQPYLLDAFNSAQQLYRNASGNQYNGPYVAQVDPQQLGIFQSMLGYGGSSGIPEQTAGAGSNLLGLGTGALTTGVNGLTDFANTDHTGANINNAGRYADNPYISGQVDAAMRDATRNASENVLPQIARNSAVTGNTNSSRRAISEGIVQRGLADQAGDISANLRGQAYTHGLDLSQQDLAQRLAAFTGAGNLGGNITNEGLGALGNSINQRGALYDIANQGGTGLTGANQAQIDDALQRAFAGDDRAQQLLNNYMAIVGGQQWGGQTVGTVNTTGNASPAAIIAGLLGAVGSFGRRG